MFSSYNVCNGSEKKFIATEIFGDNVDLLVSRAIISKNHCKIFLAGNNLSQIVVIDDILVIFNSKAIESVEQKFFFEAVNIEFVVLDVGKILENL